MALTLPSMIPDLAVVIRQEVARLQPTAADIEPAAVHQVERIQARTASGVDSNGNPWPPYAPGSAEQGIVTLGDLAECIEHEVDPAGITLAIAGEKGVIANYHNGGTKRLPRRHFFDVSASDIEMMEADIAARLNK